MSNYRHGHARKDGDNRTYRSWCSMRTRCSDPKVRQWPWYGGRGITVCDRWQKFENFLADMGVRPEGMTLDRIDNDGHYEPGNCRWADSAEQRRNHRGVRLITFNGKTQCLNDWAQELGYDRKKLSRRLARLPLAEAMKPGAGDQRTERHWPSLGTDDMIRRAQQAGVRVEVFHGEVGE